MLPRQISAAIGLATEAPLARDVPHEALVEGLAWLPAAGALVGAVACLAAWCAHPLGPAASALAAAAALAVAGGRWRGVVPGALALVSAWALVTMPEAGRPAALLVAPMLARWSVVVQCYGGARVETDTPLGALVGRARFREFGWASVTALGVTLGVLDGVGLLVVLVAALATLGMRLAAYARSRGPGRRALDATSALVETSALVVLSSVGLVLAAAH